MSRQDDILELRNNGRTLQEIGTEFGLTRERVRQLLAEQGVRTLTYDEQVDAAAKAWRASGQLRDAAEVAVEHGLAPHSATLAALRRACPDLNLPSSKPQRSRWNLEKVAAIVRRIALDNGINPETGWIKMDEYTRWRQEGDPSTATVSANYLWSDVMRLAGFDPKHASRRGRQPGRKYVAFTEADLDDAVEQYLATSDRLSAVGFETFLIEHPDLPSMATIRNRFRKRGVGSVSAIFTDVASRREAASE